MGNLTPEAFGYCWHRNTGQWYYGIHLGDIDDDYAGSGTTFRELYGGSQKQDCYAPLDWHRTIEFRGTYKECAKWEENMVTQQMIEHPLCLNLMTGGGNGKHSKETKAKMSAAQKDKPKSAEHRASLSAAKKGKTLSAEHRAKLSAARKGKPNGREGTKHTAEAIAKIRAALKGIPLSAEIRAKMSAAHKGKTISAEQRAKMSAARKGKPNGREGTKHTAEARAKISASHKERHRKIRESQQTTEHGAHHS